MSDDVVKLGGFGTLAKKLKENNIDVSEDELSSLFSDTLSNDEDGEISSDDFFNVLSQTYRIKNNNEILDMLTQIASNDGADENLSIEDFEKQEEIEEQNSEEDNTGVSEEETDLKSQYLNNYPQYNSILANINWDNPSESDKAVLAKIDAVNLLDQQTQAAQSTWEEYARSLGDVDNAYDSIKDVFGVGLTQEDVDNAFAQEEYRNEILSSMIQNGSSLQIGEATDLENGTISRDDLLSFAKIQMKDMSYDEQIEYAEKIGISKDEIFETIRSKYNIPEDLNITNLDDFITWYTSEDMNTETKMDFPSFDGISDLLSENIVDSCNNVTFEQFYAISTGVEYNASAIDMVTNQTIANTYEEVLEMQTSALVLEDYFENAEPDETYQYFLSISDGNEENAMQLFNNYYSSMLEKLGDDEQRANSEGITCTGIELKQGDDGNTYLWQELSNENGEATQAYELGDFLYYDESTGKYYQVVDINNTNNVLSTISGEGEVYTLSGMAMDTRENVGVNQGHLYNNNPLASFYLLNEDIANNNTYLTALKDTYDEKCGENAFDTILEEYPKKYKEAFGTSPFERTLNSYTSDMDHYASTISRAITMGAMAVNVALAMGTGGASLGVQTAIKIAMIGGNFVDNVIDGVNIGTSSLTNEEKQEKLKELGTQTGKEMLFVAAGMAIGKVANNVGDLVRLDCITNGASVAQTLVKGTAAEYVSDVAMSTAFDIAEMYFIEGKNPFEKDDETGNYRIADEFANELKSNWMDIFSGAMAAKNYSQNGVYAFGNKNVQCQIDAKNGVMQIVYKNGTGLYIDNGNAKYISNGVAYSASYVDGKWQVTDSEGKTITLDAQSGKLDGEFNEIDAASEANLVSIMQTQRTIQDLGTVQQDDSSTCAVVSVLNAINNKPMLLQAITNELEYNEETGTYRFSMFGDDFEVKLEDGENLLQKAYDAYEITYGKDAAGDFVTRVFDEILDGGSDIIVKPTSDNIETLKGYSDDENSILTFNTSSDIEGLSKGHSYTVLGIDDNGNIKLQDPTTLEEITISKEQYESADCQIEGKTLADEGLVDDGIQARMVAGTSSIDYSEKMPDILKKNIVSQDIINSLRDAGISDDAIYQFAYKITNILVSEGKSISSIDIDSFVQTHGNCGKIYCENGTVINYTPNKTKISDSAGNELCTYQYAKDCSYTKNYTQIEQFDELHDIKVNYTENYDSSGILVQKILKRGTNEISTYTYNQDGTIDFRSSNNYSGVSYVQKLDSDGNPINESVLEVEMPQNTKNNISNEHVSVREIDTNGTILGGHYTELYNELKTGDTVKIKSGSSYVDAIVTKGDDGSISFKYTTSDGDFETIMKPQVNSDSDDLTTTYKYTTTNKATNEIIKEGTKTTVSKEAYKDAFANLESKANNKNLHTGKDKCIYFYTEYNGERIYWLYPPSGGSLYPVSIDELPDDVIQYYGIEE